MAHFIFETIDAPDTTLGTTLLGINDSGEIVGGTSYSFTYTDGSFTTLTLPSGGGAIGGPNASGQVVGVFQDTAGTHGFVDTGGSLTTIDDPDGTNPDGSTATEATGINNAGAIVGIYEDSFMTKGFLDVGGSFTSIVEPEQDSQAYYHGTYPTGINNAGVIVGWYYAPSGEFNGFVDDFGTFTTVDDPLAAPVAVDGPLPLAGTVVTGINDADDIVGYYYDAYGHRHSFIDVAGSFTTVDAPGPGETVLLGINNEGQEVGSYDNDEGLLVSLSLRHAFSPAPSS